MAALIVAGGSLAVGLVFGALNYLKPSGTVQHVSTQNNTAIAGSNNSASIYNGPVYQNNLVKPAQPETAAAGTKPFSWIWEALTHDEMERLYGSLQGLGLQSVQVVCNRDTCTGLAESFKEVFRRLGWQLMEDGRAAFLYANGVTGIQLNRTDSTGAAFKSAVESAARLSIQLQAPALGKPVIAHILVVIGGKNLPEPMPIELRNGLQDLGYKLTDLSMELFNFSADRERDKPSLQEGFDKSRAYERETASIVKRSFGAKILAYESDLRMLGIDVPFGFQPGSADYRPELWAKWFGAVGGYFKQGKVAEARIMSADRDLWFHQ